MKTLANDRITLALDERFPRILYFESVDRVRMLGEPEAIAPRLYLYRKSDRATITSDEPDMEVSYGLKCAAALATYHGQVKCAGAKAVEFDLELTLTSDDAVLRLAGVKELGDWRLLAVRLCRVVSAGSLDGDSAIATCGWQGRLLDPAKCKPLLLDYSWCGFTARLCGAAVRPNLVVTIDIPGYEDLLVQEVRHYSRIGYSQTIASLGAELSHRQRTVEDPNGDVGIAPPEDECPRLLPLEEPLPCTQQKEVRLHFIQKQNKPLDWTDAARYFQSLIPPKTKCNPLYDNALVYKSLQANTRKPRMSVDQMSDFIRRAYNLTDGMRQVCYMTGFQYTGHDTGWPDVSVVYDAIGTKEGIRQAIAQARQYNAELSLHLNYCAFSDTCPVFDGKYVTRTSMGKIAGSMWDGNQLYGLCLPAYRKQLIALFDKVIADYGIRDTVHLDTYSCNPMDYDASPLHPTSAYDLAQAKIDFLKEINKRGIDVTSEALTDPYVGHIGHVWSLFDYGTVWEGEERIPFAAFIYHGAISWNGGHSIIPIAYFADKPGEIEDAILGVLHTGGGAGIEVPLHDKNPKELADMLYLMQPPYMMLRNRKWTGYARNGNVIRVDYASTAGTESYVQLDTSKPGYRVVVDGQVVAEDFVTVFKGPREGTLLAYSRTDRDLDWPAPAGWPQGPIPAVTLSQNGPGIRPIAQIKNGRLRVTLKGHRPVRLGPV